MASSLCPRTLSSALLCRRFGKRQAAAKYAPPPKMTVGALALGSVEPVASVRDMLSLFRIFLNLSIGKRLLADLDPSTAALSFCDLGGELRLESSQVCGEFNSSLPISSYFDPRQGLPATSGTLLVGLFDKLSDVVSNAKGAGLLTCLADTSQVCLFVFNGFVFSRLDLDAAIGDFILKYPRTISSDRLSLPIVRADQPIQVHFDGELMHGS
jgi:hypothetical protein